MYQISKRLTMIAAFVSLACGFLLTQQPTKAAITPQAAAPTKQVVKADSNVLDQGFDGTCKWDLVKDGNDIVLTIHAGQLEAKRLRDNCDYEVTKLVIDPGVIAPKDSTALFQSFFNVKEFVGLSNLNTSQVTNMNEMFAYCGAKELDLSGWDTSNVVDMSSMFEQCLNLETVNLESFNTNNVTSMIKMFCGDTKIKNLYLSNFYTPKLTKAGDIFGELNLNNLDIRNFDTSKLTVNGFFEIAHVYKLTVGPKFINQDFPEGYEGQFIIDDGIKKVILSEDWIALNGPERGISKTYYDMAKVKRNQPITYRVESKPVFENYTEYKTVIRTIRVHFHFGEIDTLEQKATIHRQVTINDDDSKTYSEWSTDFWDSYYPLKNIRGYEPKPAKVDKQIVDGNTQDQTVDIYY